MSVARALLRTYMRVYKICRLHDPCMHIANCFILYLQCILIFAICKFSYVHVWKEPSNLVGKAINKAG